MLCNCCSIFFKLIYFLKNRWMPPIFMQDFPNLPLIKNEQWSNPLAKEADKLYSFKLSYKRFRIYSAPILCQYVLEYDYLKLRLCIYGATSEANGATSLANGATTLLLEEKKINRLMFRRWCKH